jgi:hypothetical protein
MTIPSDFFAGLGAAAGAVPQSGTQVLPPKLNDAGEAGLSGGVLTSARPAPKVVSQSQLANFKTLSTQQKNQLDAWAKRLIEKHQTTYEVSRLPSSGAGVSGQYVTRELDFHDIRDILIDIKHTRGVSDLEKAYVWSKIASMRGKSSENRLIGNLEGGYYGLSLQGANPAVIDDHRTRNTPNHALLPFTDTTHGFGFSADGTPGMGHLSQRDAFARIDQREAGFFGFIFPNRGDVNASKAIIRAFHAFLYAPASHQFEAFANTWIAGFVR